MKTATCQCDSVPDRPCGELITQEDLLCDPCRAANAEGMLHAVVAALQGEEVRAVRHYPVPVDSLSRIFAPEGS